MKTIQQFGEFIRMADDILSKKTNIMDTDYDYESFTGSAGSYGTSGPGYSFESEIKEIKEFKKKNMSTPRNLQVSASKSKKASVVDTKRKNYLEGVNKQFEETVKTPEKPKKKEIIMYTLKDAHEKQQDFDIPKSI